MGVLKRVCIFLFLVSCEVSVLYNDFIRFIFQMIFLRGETQSPVYNYVRISSKHGNSVRQVMMCRWTDYMVNGERYDLPHVFLQICG